MTAPCTFFPRKSSADSTREDMNMVVTSETVKIRSAGRGSERGVGAWEAAGVLRLEVTVLRGSGVGAGWRI